MALSRVVGIIMILALGAIGTTFITCFSARTVDARARVIALCDELQSYSHRGPVTVTIVPNGQNDTTATISGMNIAKSVDLGASITIDGESSATIDLAADGSATFQGQQTPIWIDTPQGNILVQLDPFGVAQQ